GSDTQLIAPVSVADDAYVGAGTTVTRDVPSGALAVSRTPVRFVEGWMERFRARNRAATTATAAPPAPRRKAKARPSAAKQTKVARRRRSVAKPKAARRRSR